MTLSPQTVPRVLEIPLAEHRSAVASFVRSAEAVPAGSWDAPRAAGKWSPAEVTEHVRLSFEILRRDLEDGVPMRVVVPGWKRFVFRRLFLGRIVRAGKFPRGVRAPREARPAAPRTPRGEALRTLESAAAKFESACLAVPRPSRRSVTHAYFGAIRLPTACRFLARHTRHHEKQLSGG